MKLAAIKGYIQAGVGGLYLLACVILVFLQWGNKADYSLFGKNQNVHTWALMLASAAGGVLAVVMIRQFYRGVKAISRNRPPKAPPAQQEPVDTPLA